LVCLSFSSVKIRTTIKLFCQSCFVIGE
jgi:hypothetical protein